jgi:hypothetical protein
VLSMGVVFRRRLAARANFRFFWALIAQIER